MRRAVAGRARSSWSASHDLPRLRNPPVAVEVSFETGPESVRALPNGIRRKGSFLSSCMPLEQCPCGAQGKARVLQTRRTLGKSLRGVRRAHPRFAIPEILQCAMHAKAQANGDSSLKAVVLTIPATLLACADEVIE